MNNKQVKENLLIELRELTLKINKLKIFLQTNKFLNITLSNKIQAELLHTQLETMEKYQYILISRIALLQDQIERRVEQNEM